MPRVGDRLVLTASVMEGYREGTRVVVTEAERSGAVGVRPVVGGAAFYVPLGNVAEDPAATS